MSPTQIVTAFLEAFMSGNIDKASSLVRDDFSFHAPLLEHTGDKHAYFADAARKAHFIEAIRILRQLADGDDVSTLYELDIRTPKGAATMAVSEWHTVKSGQVASTFMVFNATAEAARLLGEALGHNH
jgi:predicted SnoaL-like aldol condensation-catalyzing enzyme